MPLAYLNQDVIRMTVIVFHARPPHIQGEGGRKSEQQSERKRENITVFTDLFNCLTDNN